VWIVSGVINKSKTKKPPTISPIKLKLEDRNKHPNPFATMDIETISLKDFDNIQIPVIISVVFNLKSTHLIIIDRFKLKTFVSAGEKNIEGVRKRQSGSRHVARVHIFNKKDGCRNYICSQFR
jgi:hypothetical protein